MNYQVKETTEQILERKERIKKKYIVSHIKENNEKVIEKYYKRGCTIKINKDFFKFASNSSLTIRDYSSFKDIIQITKLYVVLYTTYDHCTNLKFIFENCPFNDQYVIYNIPHIPDINSKSILTNICDLQVSDTYNSTSNNLSMLHLHNVNEYLDDFFIASCKSYKGEIRSFILLLRITESHIKSR